MEHHANLVPWQLLVQEKDGDLEFIPITDDGILRLDVFEVLLRLKPKLVAFTHVSNTLGTINPVREMTEMAHAAGALVLVDGAQAVPHLPGRRPGDRLRLLRVQRPQDARPDGLGRAVGPARAARGDAAVPGRRRDDPRGPPPPVATSTRSPGSSRRARRPSATPIGLGVAADYLMGLGMDAVREHERELVAYALEVAPARGPRDRALRPDGPGHPRRRRPVQPPGRSTRTTSPRCSTGSGSPSAPATTARCRSTSASTSRRRRAPRSASTRRARTSTRRREAALAPGLGRGAGTGRHVPRRCSAGRTVASPAITGNLVGIGDGALSLDRHRMDDLYRDYILEHYRRPHNFGVIEDADASYEGANPLCGDRITLMLGVKDGIVDRVGFTGRGCAISQASASLLTDEIKGKPLAEVERLPRRRPARAARHRDQPGPPQVRDAQPRQPAARADRSRRRGSDEHHAEPGGGRRMSRRLPSRTERCCRCRRPA